MRHQRRHHDRCSVCGFDRGEVTDRELADAVHALGARWMVFSASMRDEPSPDAPHLRPTDSAWSADEHAIWMDDLVCRCLAAVGDAVGMATRAPMHEAAADLDGAAVHLGEETDDLAALLHRADEGWWSRSAMWGGTPTPVADVVRSTLHEGYHHLVQAEQAVRMVSAT